MRKIAVFTLLLAIITSAHGGEKEIRESLQSNFPGLGKIEHVVKTSYGGLYEVLVDGQLVYTDEKGLYVFNGNVMDVKTRRNLTEERRRVLFAINFNDLPLELAVKKVKGNGKRKLAYFTDPNCSYCKKLEQELSKISDVTLYIFLYPIFPNSDRIVQNIRCSADPVKAWDDLMLRGVAPAVANCVTPTEKVKELGQRLRVNGTPNLIFGSGVQSPGYLPVEELEKNLNQVKK